MATEMREVIGLLTLQKYTKHLLYAKHAGK